MIRVNSKSSVITEPFQGKLILYNSFYYYYYHYYYHLEQWQKANVPSFFGPPDHKPNGTLKSNLFGDDNTKIIESPPKVKSELSPKKKKVEIPIPKSTLLLSPRSEKQRLEKMKEEYDSRVTQVSSIPAPPVDMTRAVQAFGLIESAMGDHFNSYQIGSASKGKHIIDDINMKNDQSAAMAADSFLNELTDMSKKAINYHAKSSNKILQRINRNDDDYSPNPKLQNYRYYRISLSSSLSSIIIILLLLVLQVILKLLVLRRRAIRLILILILLLNYEHLL